MKRIFFFMLLIASALNTNAQCKIGRVKESFSPKWDSHWQDNNPWNYKKSTYLLYKESNNNTKISIYFRNGRDEGYAIYGTYPASYIKRYVEFTGFYMGEITDPRDNYVNIRKGPGTNYAIVRTVDVGSIIYYKKTDSNWLEVYGVKYEDFDIFSMVDDPHYFEDNEFDKKIFVGYIYKDRVKMMWCP